MGIKMLNKEKGAIPLYMQLEMMLRKKIEQGEYSKGDLFPAEKELMNTYQVSRVTVRQAMARLSQTGYIRIRRGIGTDVIFDKIEEQREGVISFTDEMRKYNILIETSYCHMDLIKPGENVAMILKIPMTKECYCLRRVRNAEGRPLVYTVTYLKKIKRLPTESHYYTDSLYKYLRENHGIWLESGKDTLEAALPSEDIQKYLKIEPQMPILIRTRQTFLAGGEIYEYSKCYYPANRYKYTVDL